MSRVQHLNSFDIYRFLAAGLVIFSHSYALTGFSEPQLGNTKIGTISVWVFFILSGYLIALSWKQYPRFNVFMAKRALRIFPGLITVILISIIALGFISKLSYKDYLFNQLTLDYLNNILLLNPVHALPGVFQDNIYPSGVNGSLWTLAYEFTAYLSIAFVGAFSLFKKRFVYIVWLLLLLMNLLYVLSPENLNIYIFYLNIGLLSQLGLFFYSGVLLQIYDKNITYKLPYTLAALTCFIAISQLIPPATSFAACSLLAYAMIGLCKMTTFSGFGKYGDFSYGLYIYAFPVQQTIVHFTQTRAPSKLFALSFVITLFFAYLSWHFVEKHFIHLKKRIRHEDYPLSERHEELTHAW